MMPHLGILSDAPSRTELVAAAIKKAILRGDLSPGQRLVERDLALMLGVSTTPVREALKVLSQTGLVDVHRYKWTSVATVDEPMARHLYDLRLLLEPEAVRRAVDRHDAETLAQARGALEDASAALRRDDRAELSLANRRFHKAVYAPCDNPLLRGTLDDLQDRVALVTVVGWRQHSSWDEEAAQHAAILTAVERRDKTSAEARTRNHIETFFSTLLAVLERPEGES